MLKDVLEEKLFSRSWEDEFVQSWNLLPGYFQVEALNVQPGDWLSFDGFH